jgi:hypothetical protein
MFSTPVLFLIFNRPDLTKISFDSICQFKPTKLFIAADGPRNDNYLDLVNCKLSREIVLSKINWECDLQLLFRDDNLGCGLAVSSAIDWFFSFVDEGIILEDDCVPSPSFFFFCQNMLDKYRHNLIVGHISGSNLISNKYEISNLDVSYYFSSISHIWGWATWKRSWLNYRFNLTEISFVHKCTRYKNIFIHKEILQYWNNIFFQIKNNLLDTWDFQWQFSLWRNDQVAITPKVNLIANLGFGDLATHTTSKFDKLSNLPVSKLSTIVHPSNILINYRNDLLVLSYAYRIKFDLSIFKWKSKYYYIKSYFKKIKNLFLHVLP